MGWFGGDDKKITHATITHSIQSSTLPTLGQTINDTPMTRMSPVDTAPIDVISQPAQMTQTLRIDAPITIHSTPRMDEKAIAREVQKALDEREQRAAVHARAFLYDAVNT